MARKGDDRLYAFVDDLVTTGARALVAHLELDEATARDLMRDVAHQICVQYARSYMYVPVDLEFELSARDKDIWRKYGEDSEAARKFSPARIAELADEYSITTVQVYCIVRLMRTREREARAKDFARRQAVLPGIDGATRGGEED